MRDGAHTHHDHGRPSGLGLVLSIAAGLVLASVIESILPILLIALGVIAGLIVLGLIAHAVTSSTAPHQPPPHHQFDYLRLPVADDQQAQMAAMPGTAAGLPEQHQHLHFHGLDPAQVAAILAAQNPTRPDQEGDAW